MDDQPDFDQLSDGLVNASNQLRKLPNVPLINQGREILAAIDALQTRVNEGFERMETQIESMRTRQEAE